MPCYNESRNAVETLTTAHGCDYPEFEIIAINDGSSDDTGVILDRLAERLPRLRVIHLTTNGGKARALNVSAQVAKNELLLCIDGDALLDPFALRWTAYNFQRSDIGAFTGNPRIRNRSTVLGRMQVGEFTSIVGLIKRAQTAYGWLFTVSGVVCGFRRRALEDAGWWSSHSMTEDIDITWRIQLAGWRVVYGPSVIVWILMPETIRGLWHQRLRWAEGGARMMLDYGGQILRFRAPGLIPTYVSYFLSIFWAYLMVLAALFGAVRELGLRAADVAPDISLLPEWWGFVLALTYLAQALVSHTLDRRYEHDMLKSMFWVIWYPLAFWLIAMATTVVAVPKVILKGRQQQGTWTSPDRGFR